MIAHVTQTAQVMSPLHPMETLVLPANSFVDGLNIDESKRNL